MSRRDELVISLFDFSGNMVAPWAEAGFTCYCVDLQHPPGETRDGKIIRVGEFSCKRKIPSCGESNNAQDGDIEYDSMRV